MYNYDDNAPLAIKEIINSKINKFSLSFNCKSFPIFSNNCKAIFDNLKIFHLKIQFPDYDTINNIYNNINDMPNLEDFKMISYHKNNESYEDFINKILHLKFIRKVKIIKITKDIIPEFATIEELKKLYPNIDFNNFF